VRARVGEADHECITDDEGFIREWLKLPVPLAEDAWHSVELDLILAEGQPTVRGTTHVLVPSSRAAFGVISDMDDTVLQSEVTTFLRAARLMLLENSRTRLPFPGVAAFYRALHEERNGGPHNPIFYVSSSPWNLYDVIADFLDAQKIPTGPLLLRDWDLTSALSGHGGHKSTHIREILDAYPWLRFILIGDSGQEDPEIYTQLVAEYGARIMAVYIRNVSRSIARSSAIALLAEQVAASGSTLVLADDTLAVAKHAAARGWIDEARLADIGAEIVAPGAS
jgi:phosphatidate phosphatase APP1